MNHLVRVQIPNSARHLFDDVGTLNLAVTKVRLFLEPIKHVSAREQIENEVDLRIAFVDFFQPYNIGMIRLAHDKYFFS